MCVAWISSGQFLKNVIRNNSKPNIFCLNFDRKIYKIFHSSPTGLRTTRTIHWFPINLQVKLSSPDVISRIHKFIFCANDALGAIGGLRILKDIFTIERNGISGLCASSPLYLRKLSDFVNYPIFNSADSGLHHLQNILLSPRQKTSNVLQHVA